MPILFMEEARSNCLSVAFPHYLWIVFLFVFFSPNYRRLRGVTVTRWQLATVASSEMGYELEPSYLLHFEAQSWIFQNEFSH